MDTNGSTYPKRVKGLLSSPEGLGFFVPTGKTKQNPRARLALQPRDRQDSHQNIFPRAPDTWFHFVGVTDAEIAESYRFLIPLYGSQEFPIPPINQAKPLRTKGA